MECIALVVAGLYTENHKVSHIAPLSPIVRQDNILATQQLKTMCALEHQSSRPNLGFSTRNLPLAMTSQVRNGFDR